MSHMLLAGDIGGTKTLLGLFERGEPRPQPLHVDEFITLDHDGLESILTTFLEKHGVRVSELEASSFGVAGAITDQVAQLTNVPWRIDAGEMMRHGFRRVWLLNDLEAMAYAIPVLAADELAVLQEAPQPRRPAGARTVGRRPCRLCRAHAARARDGRRTHSRLRPGQR
jgi:glucokinase